MGSRLGKLCNKSPEEEEEGGTTRRSSVKGKRKTYKGKGAKHDNESITGDLQTVQKGDKRKEKPINATFRDRGSIHMININAKEVHAHGIQKQETSYGMQIQETSSQYESDEQSKDETNFELLVTEEVATNEDNGTMDNKLKDVSFAEDNTTKLICEGEITEPVGYTSHDNKNEKKDATYANERLIKETHSGKVEETTYKKFIQKLLREKKKSLAVAFNSTLRYIDDVLSINNNPFHSYADSIYPSELEIKDTTESSTSASYLDILLKIDLNERDDQGKDKTNVEPQMTENVIANKDNETLVKELKDLPFADDSETEMKLIGTEDEKTVRDDTVHDKKDVRKHTSNNDSIPTKPTRSRKGAKPQTQSASAVNMQFGDDSKIIGQSIKKYRSNSEERDNRGRTGSRQHHEAVNMQFGDRCEVIDQSVEEYYESA